VRHEGLCRSGTAPNPGCVTREGRGQSDLGEVGPKDGTNSGRGWREGGAWGGARSAASAMGIGGKWLGEAVSVGGC